MVTTEKSPFKGMMPRRGFLTAGVVGLGAVLGAEFHHRELEVFEHGFETDWGIFFPRYEAHNYLPEIQVTDIPPQTNALCLEIKPDYGIDPYPHIFERYSDITDQPIIKADVAQLLAEKQITLLTPDIRLPPLINRLWTVGIAVRVALILFPVLHDVIKFSDLSIDSYAKKLSRRIMIQVGISMLFLPSSLGSLFLGAPEGNRHTPQNRISHRLLSLRALLSPEDLTVNVRNLIWVVKMAEYARLFQKATGQKPAFTYRYGSAHSLIEEFIKIGPDKCLTALQSIPDGILRSIIEHNGYEAFCSTRASLLSNQIPVENISYQNQFHVIEEAAVFVPELELLAQQLGIKPSNNLSASIANNSIATKNDNRGVDLGDH